MTSLDLLRTARDARVAKQVEIERLLDSAGVDGHLVMQEFASARHAEDDAYRASSHEDRMALHAEWQREVDEILGRKASA